MFQIVMRYVMLVCYTALMGALLAKAEAAPFVVIALLLLVPMVVVARQESISYRTLSTFLVLVSVFALTVEIVGYLNGAWYGITTLPWRFFGLVPVETIVFAVAHAFYVIHLYEYFFDNRTTTPGYHKPSSAPLIITFCVVGLVGFGYLYTLRWFLPPYAFMALLCLLVIGYSILIAMARRLSVAVVKKIVYASIGMIPFSVTFLYVHLATNTRFFANPTEYVASVTLFGQMVPLEEILLLLFIPAAIIALYEMYFDDAR